MAFASLTITAPRNRLIYLNGDYSAAAGNSSGDPLVVPSGGNIAETLNGARQVDFRKEFDVDERATSVTIALDPVVPPEPV